MILQPFDVILYHGNSPISRLIRLGGNLKYSHVSLVLDVFHTLEASYKSPTSIQHFFYPIGTYDVYRLKNPLQEKQVAQIRMFVQNHVDEGYDFTYVFSRLLNKWLGTSILNSPSRYACDELILDAFFSAGIALTVESEISPDVFARSPLLEKVT